jgi:biopolymer transport protein ExbB
MDVAVQAIARFFREGGLWMYPIITTLAFAVAVSTERAIYYYFRARVNAKALLAEVTRLVRSGEAEKARQLCEKMKSPLAMIVESALWHFIKQETDREIQNAVDEIALRELPRIQRRTHYLSLFANIATLLGLLGTIFGLQQEFASLATADPSQKASMLAQGIAIALNTTAFGIAVAVFCMIMYSVLGSRANTIVEDIDESSVRLLNFLFAQRRL